MDGGDVKNKFTTVDGGDCWLDIFYDDSVCVLCVLFCTRCWASLVIVTLMVMGQEN